MLFDVWEMATTEAAGGVYEDTLVVAGVDQHVAMQTARNRVRETQETCYVSAAGGARVDDVVAYVYCDPDTGALVTEED